MADAVPWPEDELGISPLQQDTVPLAAIRGTPGADQLAGTDEDDRINALAGDDVVSGRGGDDRVFGRAGDDTLRGDAGSDHIEGGRGLDRLLGGRGADTLKGDGGDDLLDGGQGGDRLAGGGGRDTFRLAEIDGAVDRIVDFAQSVDRLDLSDILPTFVAGDPLADFVRLALDGADTLLAVSEAGTGSGFVTVARLLDVQVLTLSPADLGLPESPPGEPVLASTNADGEVADGLAFLPSLSGDGRFVTFASTAGNLVEDAAEGFNLYRKDLATGEITLVAEGQDKSALSADGTTVVHRSYRGGDITVTEIGGGAIRLGSTDEPSISADGSRAAFEDDSGGGRVALVVDTATGATITSIPGVGDANPVRATFGTGRPDLSPDGDWLAFAREGQVLLRSIVEGDDLLVSAGGNGYSTQPAVSADGRFVTFQSAATNLVAGDEDAFIDVYRAEIDPASGTVVDIELVSAPASGDTGNGDSLTPAISDDGRFIAFRSAASNLVAGDANGIPDIFVKDMASGQVQRLELVGDSSDVIPQRLFLAAPDISGDGTHVAYASDLTVVGEELVAGQVYVAPVHFGDQATLTLAEVLPEGGAAAGATGGAAIALAAGAPDLAALVPNVADAALS